MGHTHNRKAGGPRVAELVEDGGEVRRHLRLVARPTRIAEVQGGKAISEIASTEVDRDEANERPMGAEKSDRLVQLRAVPERSQELLRVAVVNRATESPSAT